MLQVLKQKNKEWEIDEPYLERLQGLPHSVFAAEIQQLARSSETTARALGSVGTGHGTDFARLSASLGEILELTTKVADSAAAAAISADKVPAQPAAAYAEIESLLARELELYTHLDAVQELVQVPELAKASAEGGLYTLAHDLYAFSQRLLARYPKSSITVKIHKETRKVMLEMRESLLGILRESPKLQVLIKTLGLLRKLEPFSERSALAPARDPARDPAHAPALQQLFAASRLEFLRAQARALSALAASNPAVYLQRYTEQFREHLATSLSAFSSVFGPSQYAAQFARQCVKDLGAAINAYYPLVKEDRQRTLLQLTYCSYSLGRLGVEFWPLLENELGESEWAEAYRTQQALSRAASERSERSERS